VRGVTRGTLLTKWHVSLVSRALKAMGSPLAHSWVGESPALKQLLGVRRRRGSSQRAKLQSSSSSSSSRRRRGGWQKRRCHQRGAQGWVCLEAPAVVLQLRRWRRWLRNQRLKRVLAREPGKQQQQRWGQGRQGGRQQLSGKQPNLVGLQQQQQQAGSVGNAVQTRAAAAVITAVQVSPATVKLAGHVPAGSVVWGFSGSDGLGNGVMGRAGLVGGQSFRATPAAIS
jgi:hypothetical protein